MTFRDYGLGWDDYTHSQYGELLLKLYGSGFTDDRALTFVNLYKYGGGFDMAAALAAKVLPFGLFETRRLVGAAIGIIGLIATWRIGRRLGGPVAGLVALVLLATCPLYYGHMFMNAKDAPFAAAMAVLLLGLVRAFEEYPKPGIRTVALAGVGLGLAFGSRILAGHRRAHRAGGAAGDRDRRSARRRIAQSRDAPRRIHLVPAAGAGARLPDHGAAVAVVDRLAAQSAARRRIFRHVLRKTMARAVRRPADPRHRHAGALSAAAVRAQAAGNHDRARPCRRHRRAGGRRRGRICRCRAAPNFLFVVLAAFFPVGLAMLAHPALYNGLRHFVFVVPPFAVLGGLAGGWLFAQTRAIPARAALAAALVGGVALPVSDMVRLHPYQYSAFNWASGGVRMAHDNYMLDYWGLAFKQAGEALRVKLDAMHLKPPRGRRWTIEICGPQPPAEVALGPDFETTWDRKRADFAMMLGTFYCRDLKAPVLVEIKREGVDFARVYDIRGRPVPNLLTEPPP